MTITTIKSQDEFEKLAFRGINNNPPKSYKHYTIKDCIIDCQLTFEETISLGGENVTFNKQLIFKKGIKLEGFWFKKCTFNHLITVQSVSFPNGIIIESSTFNKALNLSNNIFREYNYIKENIFNETVNFNNSNARNDCEFFINNNQFKKELTIQSSDFENKFEFLENVFYNGFSLKLSRFEKSFIGNNNDVKVGIANFESVYFGANAYLIKSIFNEGINLYGFIYTQSVFVTDIKVNGVTTNRETSRILKNLFLSQNDRVNTFIFHQREMNAYKNELKSTKNDSIIHQDQYNRDYLILILNEISNNYGLEWKKGLFFTFKCSIFLYISYIFSFMIQGNFPFEFGWYGFEQLYKGVLFSIENYFEFIWPTHKFNFIKDTLPSGLSNFIDVMSRIVFSFGVYQTIQAFRRFGKI